MAHDPTPFIRQAVVARLKTAVVANEPLPAAQIWPQKAPPDAPYEKLQYGQPVTVPFTAGCLDGATTTFAVHSYAETTGEGDDTVAGERRAGDLAAWAAVVLSGDDERGAAIDLQAESDCPYPATAHIEWTGTQVIADGLGTDAFHGIVTFSATVAS